MKNYVGFARDHSVSMRPIARAAAKDYNANIASVREASISNNQDTKVSVVECGYDRTNLVRTVISQAAVTALTPLTEGQYTAAGYGTPLWDSVGQLIENFQKSPDVNDPETSFLLLITTDGEENSSVRYSARSIVEKITELQKTDRWTFVFRVPRGGAKTLIRFGIPEGNIMEWDQTQCGVETAQAATTQAFGEYFSARASGMKSTTKFYANLESVTSKDVETTLTDISKDVLLWPVSKADNDSEIRPFVEARLNGDPLLKGAAFYQLTKTEPKVQDYKKIVIRDRTTNAIYGGDAARQMLGLPNYGDIRLAPDKLGNFDVFIQSTSVNRKLPAGSQCLYWAAVGVPFTEGPSARKSKRS